MGVRVRVRREGENEGPCNGDLPVRREGESGGESEGEKRG